MMSNHARRLSAVFSLFLASGLVACAGEATAPTVAQETCRYPWAKVSAAAPEDIRITEIPDTQAFLQAYNAHPPASDVAADRVFYIEQGGSVLLFFVTDGCTIGNGRIPAEDFNAIRGIES